MHVGGELAAGNRDLTFKGLMGEEELTEKKKSGKRPKREVHTRKQGALFLEGGSCQLLRSSLAEEAGWELEVDIISAM